MPKQTIKASTEKKNRDVGMSDLPRDEKAGATAGNGRAVANVTLELDSQKLMEFVAGSLPSYAKTRAAGEAGSTPGQGVFEQMTAEEHRELRAWADVKSRVAGQQRIKHLVKKLGAQLAFTEGEFVRVVMARQTAEAESKARAEREDALPKVSIETSAKIGEITSRRLLVVIAPKGGRVRTFLDDDGNPQAEVS
jgi:hypothetical protein